MADNLGTLNKITIANELSANVTLTGTPANVDLPVITLPNIANATIVWAVLKLHFRMNETSNASDYYTGGNIHIQKSGGSYIAAIGLASGIWDCKSSGLLCQGGSVVGTLDITGQVDAFNQSFDVRMLGAAAATSNLVLHDIYAELDVYYTIDSTVEEDVEIVTSEIASHALGDSTSDSVTLSAVDGISATGEATTQSMIASHALEIDSELSSHALEMDSELSSHALEQNTEESATQSEVASHALEQSEVLSEVVSALAERDIDLSELTSFALEQNTEEGYTQSEVASHALEQNTEEGATQSEIASHALEQSEILSEAISALEERDIDLSELTSFALEQNTEEGLTQSEIASHVVERSEVLSTAESSLQLHDTDNKALQRVVACPDLMYVPQGRTQINDEDGITAIATTIPVTLSGNLLSEGIVLIESEYIIYTGVSGGSLTGCTRGAYSTSGAIHADGTAVAQSILYPVRLTIKDNEGNMLAPDSAPTITVDDWNGVEELSPTAMTLISTGVYGYNYIIDYGDIPENKIFIFTHVIDSITATTRHEVVIINQPASYADVLEGGDGDYVLDQDGWYDTDGIETAWTDAGVGYVRDSVTGAPLDDAFVTAYPIIGGETMYSGRPSAESRTKTNGTWLMNLDAGTYTFVIKKEGFQIVGDGVFERTVG